MLPFWESGQTRRSGGRRPGAGRSAGFFALLLAGGLAVPAFGGPPGAPAELPALAGAGPGGPFADFDLVLEFGTYILCRARAGVQDLAVDSEGNVVVVGFLPRDCDRGEPDAVLLKFAPDGTLLASQLNLGGSGADVPNGVALDEQDNIYIAGGTRGARTRRPFPVVDPFQGDNAGPPDTLDAFVMKLDPTGETILYSTFLGGTGADVATDVAVDETGRIVVVGITDSVDFPTEAPLQGGLAGGRDAFLTVFVPDGSELAFSTYYGGVEDDRSTRLAVLRDRIFFTGLTGSPDLPTRVPGRRGALDPVYGGGASDAFVVRIDRLERLGYAGYLGGSQEDAGYGLDVDRSGSAYVTGTTDSAEFPTVRALQESLSEPGEADAFLTQLNPSGARARFSTYLDAEGSAECERFTEERVAYCTAVSVDEDQTAFVTAKGFFAIAVSKNGREILGALEGFGGTTIEVSDAGVYVGGITKSFEAPLAGKPGPELRDLFVEGGWVVRLTRQPESEPGPPAGRP